MSPNNINSSQRTIVFYNSARKKKRPKMERDSLLEAFYLHDEQVNLNTPQYIKNGEGEIESPAQNDSMRHFEELVGSVSSISSSTSSEERERQENPPKYISYWFRRYMCQKFSKYGDCDMNGCRYMHSPPDLSRRQRCPWFKSYYCSDYHNSGYCIEGYKCLLIHEEDLRNLDLGLRLGRPILGRGEMLLKNVSRDIA